MKVVRLGGGVAVLGLLVFGGVAQSLADGVPASPNVSLGAFANGAGHAVGFYLVDRAIVSVYTDGREFWTESRVLREPVASLALAVCGNDAWVFVLAPDGGTRQPVHFSLRATFPCEQHNVIYVPVVCNRY